MRAAITFLAAAALLLGAAGCGDDGDATSGEGPLQVVASFYPLYEVAREVGGSRVSVANLTPAGSEPHDLELTPRQVEQIEDADLVLVLGRDFQPAVEQAAGRRSDGTVELLDVLGEEGRVEEHAEDEHAGDEHAGEEEEEEEHDGLDPHVWLDPVRMVDLVDAVAGAMTEADPRGAATYEANAKAYATKVDDLHRRFERTLEPCPRKLLVTAHEAFGRLAQRYGLEQEGIAGISPDAEPDPRRLDELTDLVEREGVTTIFTESLVSPEIAETLAREAGVETAVLDPIEGLSAAAIGAGGTYLSVMNDNLLALERALGCP